MKTTLLAFLCVALCSFSKTFAQPCDLTNLQFERIYTGTDGKCYADVYFDMNRNNGNKFVYLHFWTAENFSKVNKAKFSNRSAPKYTDINGTPANSHQALATIAIDNDDYSSPLWNAYNYRPDAAVVTVRGGSLQVSAAPVSGSGSKALYRYTVRAIPLGPLGGGCSARDIAAIVWSTQANSVNSQIHCYLTGPAAPQSLAIEGMAECAIGKYTVTLTNTSDKTVSGSFDVYASNSLQLNDDMFDPSTLRKFDVISYFVIEPKQAITITRSIPASCLGYSLFAQVMLSDNQVQTAQLLATSCRIMPVILQAFSASRTKQGVVLSWQTASEQNVLGFNILRQTGESSWEIVQFVPSQAAGGFSSQPLSYQLTDMNTFKGTSQYRIQTVDADGKTNLSEVKMVRGEEHAARMSIYPNPSTNGTAVLVFDYAAVRDINLLDVSGRVVKRLKNVTTTTISLQNVNNGLYSVQVIDRNTNETTIVRLVVKK